MDYEILGRGLRPAWGRRCRAGRYGTYAPHSEADENETRPPSGCVTMNSSSKR